MQQSPLAPLTKKTLSDIARESLSRYIGQMLNAGQTKLPSEVELARILSVSRTTIRRALTDLEGKGTIMRIHGKGTFINPNLNQMKLDLYTGHDYYQLIRKSGFEPGVKVLSRVVQEASPLQRSDLGLKEDDQILALNKVYYADEKPCLLCINYFPQTLYDWDTLSDEVLEAFPFELIQEYAGIRCVRDSTEITTAGGNEVMAYTMGEDLLQCDSLLILDSIYYDNNNTPVFLSKTYFNTDYIKFTMIRAIEQI
ncbi:GntR family transcriptional regulator [Diplocloster modestus]|uniref:GntR family transcriptional regulator n=1 Tax=Diplocloster modestus TaxID=2850322 RepID=A0ABS6KBQ9_9FIRM|nr:GntR family transcriptional regulator [Diplocloster modestus]MBU9727933.1 GntR family transcriptional regulator [Diplocloster modestus]